MKWDAKKIWHHQNSKLWASLGPQSQQQDWPYFLWHPQCLPLVMCINGFHEIDFHHCWMKQSHASRYESFWLFVCKPRWTPGFCYDEAGIHSSLPSAFLLMLQREQLMMYWHCSDVKSFFLCLLVLVVKGSGETGGMEPFFRRCHYSTKNATPKREVPCTTSRLYR